MILHWGYILPYHILLKFFKKRVKKIQKYRRKRASCSFTVVMFSKKWKNKIFNKPGNNYEARLAVDIKMLLKYATFTFIGLCKRCIL
jgi:hypothetical protein